MNFLKRERRIIFAVAICLTLFGLLMVYESSSMYAFKVFGDSAYFFKRQLIFSIAGIALFFLSLVLDLSFLKRYYREIMLFAIILLLFVILIGKTAGGAKRWIRLGWFNIQPSEFLKIAFVIYCAGYFTRKKELIKSISKGLLPLFFIFGLLALLLLGQPDFGSVIFLGLWVFIMLFLGGAKKNHLIFLILAGAAAIFILIKLSPYRLGRIIAFLNPWADPQGKGFQIIQSQIAYGSGSLFGVGFGESKQKLLFLPAAHTDFIFSIIAEEFGFLGSFLLIGIIVFFLYKIYRVLEKITNPFNFYAASGIWLIYVLETAMNIGVSCGIFPTKGLSLPFISYGGSAMAANFIMLGMLFNFSRNEENSILL